MHKIHSQYQAITYYHQEKKITQLLHHSSITPYHQEQTKTLASSPIKQLLLTQSLCQSQQLQKTQMKGCLQCRGQAHLATMQIEEQPQITGMQRASEE